MDNRTNRYAEKALKITTTLTFIVAGYEVSRACQNYKSGMNVLDMASYANADLSMYCIVLILANMISFVLNKGRTELAFAGWGRLSVSQIILMSISLGLVSGICKEIYFRGFAKNFCGDILGETAAFLLFNVMFGLLDWFNMGLSFILGLLWIWGYKKSKHLIVPMIAHGGVNLIAVVFYTM